MKDRLIKENEELKSKNNIYMRNLSTKALEEASEPVKLEIMTEFVDRLQEYHVSK